jgi:hypothetical protein
VPLARTRRRATARAADRSRSPTRSGSLIERLADEAEAGYDVEEILGRRGKRGRPSLGTGPSAVESVRLDPELKERLVRRAEADGVPVSDVIRDASATISTLRPHRPHVPFGTGCEDGRVTEGLPPMPRHKRKRERRDGRAFVVGTTIRLLILVGGLLILGQPRWVHVAYALVVLFAALTWWWKDGR